ncbi:MAG: hypothetical protein ACFFC1_19685 [Promethearchaeota archaeon]
MKDNKESDGPILTEHDRASLLNSLDCVDLVVIYVKNNPIGLIHALKSVILFKVLDYRSEEAVGREVIESYGSQIRLVPLLKGYSKTGITNRVLVANKSSFSSE